MERPFTNRARRVRGNTVCVTVRLHQDVVAFIDAHATPQVRSRSERLQDLVNRWALETEKQETWRDEPDPS